jgi:hypothetical protein
MNEPLGLTALAAGTNYAPVGIVAAILWNYYRLQRHRADAVAMASYRKLAEEAVANMAEVRAEVAKLTEHVSAVEQLMRDVG